MTMVQYDLFTFEDITTAIAIGEAYRYKGGGVNEVYDSDKK
jgi:hypothetical protein